MSCLISKKDSCETTKSIDDLTPEQLIGWRTASYVMYLNNVSDLCQEFSKFIIIKCWKKKEIIDKALDEIEELTKKPFDVAGVKMSHIAYHKECWKNLSIILNVFLNAIKKKKLNAFKKELDKLYSDYEYERRTGKCACCGVDKIAYILEKN